MQFIHSPLIMFAIGASFPAGAKSPPDITLLSNEKEGGTLSHKVKNSPEGVCHYYTVQDADWLQKGNVISGFTVPSLPFREAGFSLFSLYTIS